MPVSNAKSLLLTIACWKEHLYQHSNIDFLCILKVIPALHVCMKLSWGDYGNATMLSLFSPVCYSNQLVILVWKSTLSSGMHRLYPSFSLISNRISSFCRLHLKTLPTVFLCTLEDISHIKASLDDNYHVTKWLGNIQLWTCQIF